MAVNVIDNVDKGVNKKAKGCYQNRLLKGWQWRIDTHVGTGRLLTGARLAEIYIRDA